MIHWGLSGSYACFMYSIVLPYVFGSVLACLLSVQVFQNLSYCHMCSVLFLPVYCLFKCFRICHTAICVRFCSCLFIVCSNVSEDLMCLVLFLSLLMYVFQKLSYSLCRLCLSFLTNSSSDSKAFLHFIAIPASSTTAVHRAFLFFDVKAWPQSQTDLFTCTTVLHCGIPF